MKHLLVIFSVFIITTSGYTQSTEPRRFEIWGGISIMQYFGDIGGSADKGNLLGLKDISLKSNRPGFSIGGAFKYNDQINFKASNTFGVFAQTDKGSRNSNRDFAFSTLANETTIQIQYFFIREKKNYYLSMMNLRGGSKNVYKCFSFYGFGGLGTIFFKVTPKESYAVLPGLNRLVDSKSLSVTMPIGVGLKIAYSQALSFGAELGSRYTFTDKLDGLIPPTSKFNDIYYVMSFKVIYHIPRSSKIKRRLNR